MARRIDLIAEIDTTLDGSGDYTGEWIDSCGIRTIRVANVGSGVRIEESNNQTDIVQVNTSDVAPEGLPYNKEEITITARWLRVRGYGSPNGPLHAAVRVIG